MFMTAPKDSVIPSGEELCVFFAVGMSGSSKNGNQHKELVQN